MRLITKITDLEYLLVNKIPENHLLEFKSVGIFSEEQEKEKLLKEIIAFANAEGGQLIIGIEEDDNQVASEISGINSHLERAQKIQQWCDSNVEPPLKTVKADSIPIDESKGVIIVTIRASQNAPHRLLKGQQSYNKHAYIRRNRDAMPMSMQEIHDLVRLRDRGAADIEDRMKELWINQQLLKDKQNSGHAGYILKILAVQSQKMNCDITNYVPTFYLDENFKILGTGFREWLYDSCSKRRILRGISFHQTNQDMTIKQDGSIELTERLFPQDRDGRILTIGRIVTLFTIAAINALRIQDPEGSDIYLSCSIIYKHLNGTGTVGNYDKLYKRSITQWEVSHFPIYSLNDFKDLLNLAEKFMADVFHDDGKEVPAYQNKIVFPDTLE